MTPRLTASDKVARLLAVIPYVAGRGPVPIDDIATRFSYPRKELVADLTGVVSFVGVAPFTPDTMIEVTVDDEHVWITYGNWFERPMRLDPAEALALFAAGRALLAASGDDEAAGPLLRGLTKLGAAMGAGGDVPVDIVLGSAEERVLGVLRDAVAANRCVHLDYYSYGRDDRTERVVEPQRVFADDGQWYLAAFCRRVEADRVFRVDRIRAVTVLDETFTPDANSTAVIDPSAADARVTLDLAPEARWVLDQYPHDSVTELDDGTVRVTLPVTAPAWLERLLVRLGPLAVPVALPRGFGDAPAADAARRILARYPPMSTA